VAKFLGCEPNQVIFTSGGSEGNNMVIKGLAPYLRFKGRTHIVCSIIEHDSVDGAMRSLAADDGFQLSYAKADRTGEITVESLKNALTPKTGLVSIMACNNEVGTWNNVASLASISHNAGSFFMSDYVQAAGQHISSPAELGVDFATISGHKIHGPKGIGAVFVKDKHVLTSLIDGGNGQEFGRRGGTENVAGIVGLGKACEMCDPIFMFKHIQKLRSSFVHELLIAFDTSDLSEAGFHVNGKGWFDTSKSMSFRIDGVSAEALILAMDAAGVCVSAGSACHAQQSDPSRVLLACGLTEEEARQTIRVSFSDQNTAPEVRKAAKLLAACVKMLRSQLIQ
jgi:cysteine desulfurase